MTLESLEREFALMAQRIYELGEVFIQPTWPWVLIRVVPKEQRFGSLILPDNAGAQAQNKPQWEGIVLQTWKPHWSSTTQTVKETAFTRRDRDGEIWRESDFKRGDRVLFPHFAGMPGPQGLDSNKYRLVREWTFDPNGGVQGIIHYEPDKRYREVLDNLFSGMESVTLSGK